MLFEISDMAYGFLTSACSSTGADSLEELYLANTTEPAAALLDDIESKWVQTIADLRVRSDEEYGAAFEETQTTNLLSYILSFRTDGLITPHYRDARDEHVVYGPVEIDWAIPTQRRMGNIYHDLASYLLPGIDVPYTDQTGYQRTETVIVPELKVLVVLYQIRKAFERNANFFAAPSVWGRLGVGAGVGEPGIGNFAQTAHTWRFNAATEPSKTREEVFSATISEGAGGPIGAGAGAGPAGPIGAGAGSAMDQSAGGGNRSRRRPLYG